MLFEPAASVTDWVLAGLAAWLGFQLFRRPQRPTYWALAFWSTAIGALVGALYHGTLKRDESLADPTWTLITIIVAVTVSLLLGATVQSLMPGSRNRSWMALRLGTLGAFCIAALAGHGGLTTFFVLESATMVGILGIWAWAGWRGEPGSRMVLLAIFLSGGAGLFRFLPVGFHLGWEWDNSSIYHVAQMPGLVALYLAIGQLRFVRERTPASGWRSDARPEPSSRAGAYN
jgi:hypothetical protein